MKKIKNLLSGPDIFKSSIGLSYFGRKHLSSWASILVTTVILILTVLAFIEFSKDFIGQQNPIVSKSERNYFTNRLLLENSKQNTVFGVNLIFNNGTLVDRSSKLYFYLEYISSDNTDFKNIKTNRTIFKSQSCQNTLKSFRSLEGFNESQTEQINKFSCFDIHSAEIISGSPVPNLELNGDFLKPTFKDLNIIVTSCPWNPVHRNYSCSNEEGEALSEDDLSKLTLLLFFPNFELHFENNENPIKPFFETKFIPLLSEYSKNIEIRFTKGVLTTDNGWMMEKQNTEEFFLLEEFSQSDQKKKMNILATIKMTSSMKENIYKRKYDKVQDVIAKVGGLMKVLIFIATYFLQPFNNLLSFFYLLKKIEKEISRNSDDMKPHEKQENRPNNYFSKNHSPTFSQLLVLSYLPKRLHKYFKSIHSLSARLKKGLKTVDFKLIFKKLYDKDFEFIKVPNRNKPLSLVQRQTDEPEKMIEKEIFKTLPSVNSEPPTKKPLSTTPEIELEKLGLKQKN